MIGKIAKCPGEWVIDELMGGPIKAVRRQNSNKFGELGVRTRMPCSAQQCAHRRGTGTK